MVSASTDADAWAGLPELPHTAQELSGGIVARRHHFASLLNSGRGIRRHPGPGDLGRRIAASPWSLGLPHGYGETRTVGFGVLGGLSSPVPSSWGDRFGARRNQSPTPPMSPGVPTPTVDVAPARPRTAPRPPAPRGNAPRRVIRSASISEGPDEPAAAAPLDTAPPPSGPVRRAPASASPAPATVPTPLTPSPRTPSPHTTAPGAIGSNGSAATGPVQRLADPSTPVPPPRATPPVAGGDRAPANNASREDAASGARIDLPGGQDTEDRAASDARREIAGTPTDRASDAEPSASAPSPDVPVRRAIPRRRAEYGLPAQRLEDPAAPGDAASRPGTERAPGRARTPWGTLRGILSNRASTPRAGQPGDASGATPAPGDASAAPRPSATSNATAAPAAAGSPGAAASNDPSLSTPGASAGAGSSPAGEAAADAPSAADRPGAGAPPSSTSADATSMPVPVVQRLTEAPARSTAGDEAPPSAASVVAAADTAAPGDETTAPGASSPSYAPPRGLPGPGMLGRALRDGMRLRQGANAPHTVSLGVLSGLAVRGAMAPASLASPAAAPASTSAASPPASTPPSMQAWRGAQAARGAVPEASSPVSPRPTRSTAGGAGDEPGAARPVARDAASAPLQRIASTRPIAFTPPTSDDHARTASAGATGLRANVRRDLGTAAMVARLRSGVRIARIFSDTTPLGGRPATTTRASDAPFASSASAPQAATSRGRAAASMLGRPGASFSARGAAQAAVQRLAAPRPARVAPGRSAGASGSAANIEGVRTSAPASATRAPADDALFAPVGTVLASRWSAYRVAGSPGARGVLEAAPDPTAARALPRGTEARPLTSPSLAAAGGFAAMGRVAVASRGVPGGVAGASSASRTTPADGARSAAPRVVAPASTSPDAIQRIAAPSTSNAPGVPSIAARDASTAPTHDAQPAPSSADAATADAATAISAHVTRERAIRGVEAPRTGGGIGATGARAQAIAAGTRDRARMPLAFAEPRTGEIAVPPMPARTVEGAAPAASAAPPAVPSALPDGATRPAAAAARRDAPAQRLTATRARDDVQVTRSVAASRAIDEAADRVLPTRVRSGAPGALGTALRSAALRTGESDDATRVARLGAATSARVRGDAGARAVEAHAPIAPPSASAGRASLPAAGTMRSAAPIQRLIAPEAAAGASIPTLPAASSSSSAVQGARLVSPVMRTAGTSSDAAEPPLSAAELGASSVSRGAEGARRARGHAGVFVAGHAPLPRAVEAARVVGVSPLASLAARPQPAGIAAAQQARAAQRMVAASTTVATRRAASMPGTSQPSAPASSARAGRPERSGTRRLSSERVTTVAAPSVAAGRDAATPAPGASSGSRAGSESPAASALRSSAVASRATAEARTVNAVQRMVASTPRAGARTAGAATGDAAGLVGTGRLDVDRRPSSFSIAAAQRMARTLRPDASRPDTSPAVTSGGAASTGDASRGVHADHAALALPRALRGPSSVAASGVTPLRAHEMTASLPVAGRPSATVGDARYGTSASPSRAMPLRLATGASMFATRASARGGSSLGVGHLARDHAPAALRSAAGARAIAVQRIALPRAERALAAAARGGARHAAAHEVAGLPSTHGGRPAFVRSSSTAAPSLPTSGARSRPTVPAGRSAGAADLAVQRIAGRAGDGGSRVASAVAGAMRSVRDVPVLPRATQHLIAPHAVAPSASTTTRIAREGVASGGGRAAAMTTTHARTAPAQRLALPRGQRPLRSVMAPANPERESDRGMRILDVPPATEAARVAAQTGDLPFGGATLTAEAALRAVAAAADFRRDRGEIATASGPGRPSTPAIAAPAMPVVPAAAATSTSGLATAPSVPGSASTAPGRRAVQRLARGARAGLPRATGPATTASIGALSASSGAGPGAGILATRGGGRPDITSLPVGAAGAAGAVGAARRAAAEVVQTAVSSVGMEADAHGVMHPGESMRASFGGGPSGSGSGGSGGGGSSGGSMGHASDGTYVAPAPVQRMVEDEADADEDPGGKGGSAAAEQDRISDMLEQLEARILAQIERRGGRYRGMFS